MRKLILQLAVSLDGFIEGPNGEYDWCFTDQDYGMSQFFQRIDALFIGRRSYELLESMEESVPGMPKLTEYVFSRTRKDLKPGAILISDRVDEEVRKIKEQDGKDIWLFGGASLTTSLMNAGHVDEICLAVHPIILGSGKPLFAGIMDRVPLTLTDSKAYDSGLMMLTYIPKK